MIGPETDDDNLLIFGFLLICGPPIKSDNRYQTGIQYPTGLRKPLDGTVQQKTLPFYSLNLRYRSFIRTKPDVCKSKDRIVSALDDKTMVLRGNIYTVGRKILDRVVDPLYGHISICSVKSFGPMPSVDGPGKCQRSEVRGQRRFNS